MKELSEELFTLQQINGTLQDVQVLRKSTPDSGTQCKQRGQAKDNVKAKSISLHQLHVSNK